MATQLVKRVDILHSQAAAGRRAVPVQVHVNESGCYKHLQVAVSQPILFDEVVTASIHETAPGLANFRKLDLSFRDLARALYFGTAAVYARCAETVKVSEPVLDTRSVEPNNMAHLLLDIIPCVLHARRVLGREVLVLSRSLQDPFRRLLETFAIPRIASGRNIEADFIKIRGARGLHVFDLLGHPECPAHVSLPDPYQGITFESSVKFDRIFLARRGPRALLNHGEVESVVRRFGYEMIFMEDYSIHDQLSIGAQAKHVVAIHGAAMAFLALNRAVDSVIELMPPHVYHEMFAMCPRSQAMRYHVIISEFDPVVVHSGWSALLHHKERPFATDLKLLEKSLLSVHQ